MLLELITAAPPSGPDWTWLTQGGAIGVLALAVFGFVTGRIVPGTQVTELRGERDRALEQVYKQAEIAQRALEILEKKVAP